MLYYNLKNVFLQLFINHIIETYMKKYFLTCCIIFAATILITSCGEDEGSTDTNPTFASYFENNEGTSWVYDNYVITQDEEETFIQKLALQDTLTQGANKVVLGKDAMSMRHRFINPIMSSSTVANYAMAEDKSASKLYVNDEFLKIFVIEYLQSFLDIVFDSEKWYILADAKATKEWTIDSFLLTEVELPGPSGMPITLNGHLKFAGIREKDTTIKSINSHTFSLNIFFKGTTTLAIGPFPFTVPVRIDFKKIDFYLGEKKGLLGIYSPANTVLLTLENPVPDYPSTMSLPMTLDGFDKKLED